MEFRAAKGRGGRAAVILPPHAGVGARARGSNARGNKGGIARLSPFLGRKSFLIYGSRMRERQIGQPIYRKEYKQKTKTGAAAVPPVRRRTLR